MYKEYTVIYISNQKIGKLYHHNFYYVSKHTSLQSNTKYYSKEDYLCFNTCKEDKNDLPQIISDRENCTKNNIKFLFHFTVTWFLTISSPVNLSIIC